MCVSRKPDNIQQVTESVPLALRRLGPLCDAVSGNTMLRDVSAPDADAGISDSVAKVTVDADATVDCWKGD